MGQEDQKQSDVVLSAEMPLEYFVPLPTVCGIPVEGVEAVYWNNEPLWEKTKE